MQRATDLRSLARHGIYCIVIAGLERLKDQLKGKVVKACGEFYTLDKDGNRVELFVDPTNGQIIGRM